MAMLAGYGTFLLEAILPQIASRGRVLSLARMSITWDADDLKGHLERLRYDYDRAVLDQIRSQGHYFSTEEFFRLVGFRHYDDIDIDAASGVTIVHDLNDPVPAALHQRFDLVCENGTIEHIFDTRAVMGSIAHLVKVGGYVSHGSPLDAFNHGFYNFSINFFHDFYRMNGFEEFRFYLVRYAANWHENQRVVVRPLEYTHEEFYIEPDVYDSDFNKFYLGCLARKAEHVSETRTPIQAAYDPALGLDSRLSRNSDR